jgi:IMP dehydrogenase
MDTVSEAALAIALAQEGGIGIIHKNLSVEAQKREVAKVKRSEHGVILDPVTLSPGQPVRRAQELMNEQNVSGIPIVDGKKLVGILTRRDLKFLKDYDVEISSEMVKSNLVTGPAGTTLEQAKEILQEHKVEKLLLVNGAGELAGLITMRDIDRVQQYPIAARDRRGRLRVGAAVSVHDYERIEALIVADVDIIVVDTAHGHSQNVIDTVKKIKAEYDIDVIAGNIATAEAAEDLIAAGANAIKVGIGPGAICTTRVISGVGVPQVSAIISCAKVAGKHNIPVIADGGIRQSGDITERKSGPIGYLQGQAVQRIQRYGLFRGDGQRFGGQIRPKKLDRGKQTRARRRRRAGAIPWNAGRFCLSAGRRTAGRYGLLWGAKY